MMTGIVIYSRRAYLLILRFPPVTLPVIIKRDYDLKYILKAV